MAARLDEASQWWSVQRRRYNTVVVGVGAICFVLHMALASGLPYVELTVFTLGVQLVAGALYLMVANVAYSLAAAAERRLRPADVQRFRSKLFLAGVALTVAPFVAVPALLVLRRLIGI